MRTIVYDDTELNIPQPPLDALVALAVANLDAPTLNKFTALVGEAIANDGTLAGLLTSFRNSPECYAKVAQSDLVTRPILDPDGIYCNSQCPFLTKNDSVELTATCSLTQNQLVYLKGFIASCDSPN